MGIFENAKQESSYSVASGRDLNYVVLQVTLKEKFIGTGSGNLLELEEVINRQAAKGYRLHTIATSSGGSKGFMGGDRIQATLVFESI
jgi:phage protein